MANLYLIGMMGSGKSVTGKKLAGLLNQPFVDLDALIQEKHQCTIAELFGNKGEEFFRETESEILKETIKRTNQVVATGGGIVLKPTNLEDMRKTGKILYLVTSLEVLWSRVMKNQDRPLLQGKDPQKKLEEIFKARQAHYEKAADFQVKTDGLTPEAVAKKIVALLEGHK